MNIPNNVVIKNHDDRIGDDDMIGKNPQKIDSHVIYGICVELPIALVSKIAKLAKNIFSTIGSIVFFDQNSVVSILRKGRYQQMLQDLSIENRGTSVA